MQKKEKKEQFPKNVYLLNIKINTENSPLL